MVFRGHSTGVHVHCTSVYERFHAFIGVSSDAGSLE